jgi:hypothetical protein
MDELEQVLAQWSASDRWTQSCAARWWQGQKNLSPCRIQTFPNDYLVERAVSIKNEVILMRFICLGFHDETNWDEMSESERNSFMQQCFAYDDELRRGRHFLGGEALQTARNAVTVRWQSGKVAVTDGPYAETKEQLGGILFLEARDLNHAIQLMSKHPGVRAGGFEIRAADEEINALIAARKA